MDCSTIRAVIPFPADFPATLAVVLPLSYNSLLDCLRKSYLLFFLILVQLAYLIERDDSMPSIPSAWLQEITDIFSLERNSLPVGTANGFFCGRNYPSTIQLVENIDVQDGDWLIHSATGRRYYAEKTEPISANGQIVSWMVQYQSESEYKNNQRSQSTTSINIGTVSGPSIIGSQQNATLNFGTSVEDIAQLITNKPASELPQLCELVAELKDIEKSEEKIEKGRLAKFADLLNEHSDLLTALGGWAVKLLTGNE